MIKLSTRNRIFILTSLICLLFLILKDTDFRVLLGFEFYFDPVKPFFFALMTYIGTIWVLFFKIKGERFITISLFPALAILALTTFISIILKDLNSVEQFSILIFALIILWIFLYITLLTVNILNTAYVSDVPLEQAAKAALFVITLIVGYLDYFLLFSNDFFIIIRALVAGISTFLLVNITLWTIELKLKHRIIASINISLLQLFASLVLSIWPATPPYIALVLVLMLYITLGIALEIREIISRWIWVEYISLFVLIILLLLLTSEWGINGSII